MKFISISTKEEGEAIPNAYIAFGRCRERERVATMYGAGTRDDSYVFNGFYVRLASPFTTKQTYLDFNTFEPTTGPGRLTIGLRARRPAFKDKMAFTWFKVWTPLIESK